MGADTTAAYEVPPVTPTDRLCWGAHTVSTAVRCRGFRCSTSCHAADDDSIRCRLDHTTGCPRSGGVCVCGLPFSRAPFFGGGAAMVFTVPRELRMCDLSRDRVLLLSPPNDTSLSVAVSHNQPSRWLTCTTTVFHVGKINESVSDRLEPFGRIKANERNKGSGEPFSIRSTLGHTQT